ELLVDQGNRKDLASDPAFAIDELVCNSGKNDPHHPKICDQASKKVLKEAFDEYVALQDGAPIKYLDDAAIGKILNEEFAPLVKEVEEQCREIKQNYDKVEAETNKQM